MFYASAEKNLCVFLSRLLQVPKRGTEFTTTDHCVKLKQALNTLLCNREKRRDRVRGSTEVGEEDKGNNEDVDKEDKGDKAGVAAPQQQLSLHPVGVSQGEQGLGNVQIVEK